VSRIGDRSQETGVRRREGMREKARGFEDLIVWQKAHRFVIGIYSKSIFSSDS